MNIKSNAFAGPIMSAFNGRAISPAMSDANTPTKGATDTMLYNLIEDGKVTQTRGLYLSADQVTA